jgi:hypothetical protein
LKTAPPPALTPERSSTLRAAVARILPGEAGPGAAATGAAQGFENALGHPYFRGLRPGIEKALDWLDARAAKMYGRDFAACTSVEQDEVLRTLEQEPNPWTRFLFRSLIGFSLEGMLGDPVHGGNRDFKGWEALGLLPAEVRSGLCLGARIS